MFLSRDNTQDDVNKVIIIYFFNLNENLSFHIIIKYLHMISHSIILLYLINIPCHKKYNFDK